MHEGVTKAPALVGSRSETDLNSFSRRAAACAAKLSRVLISRPLTPTRSIIAGRDLSL